MLMQSSRAERRYMSESKVCEEEQNFTNPGSLFIDLHPVACEYSCAALPEKAGPS